MKIRVHQTEGTKKNKKRKIKGKLGKISLYKDDILKNTLK